MTNEEKIEMLENTLELDKGSLKPEMKLKDIPEYDSMAKLTLIVMMDDELGKKLTGEDIQSFNIVQDVLDFMD